MKKIVNLVCNTTRLVLEMSTTAALRALGEGGAENIDAIDAENLKVFVTKESAAVSGVVVFRKAENATKAHTFAIDGTTIDVNVGTLEEGVTRIGVIVQYGTNMRSAVLFNVTRPAEASEGTTTKQYDIEADKSFGGGSVDFKTDVYMDGDGRVILERLDDGSTVIFDEYENPILKRNADGSTVYFDAYQSERMRINAHGDVDFNANVTGAGMRRVALVYDSATNTIQLDGVVQTYAQVEALIANTGNFVTLQDGDDTSFLLPHYGDGAAIIFTGLDVFSTGDYSHRIAINSDEDVKREYFAIQRRKVVKVIANDVAEVMLNQDEVVIAEARTADLTVTLPYMAPKGAEFHLFIEVAGTPTITWPTGITWAGGEAPTLENGKTVEVSFVNNFATSVTYENV